LLLGNNEFIIVTERPFLYAYLTQKERFCSSFQVQNLAKYKFENNFVELK